MVQTPPRLAMTVVAPDGARRLVTAAIVMATLTLALGATLPLHAQLGDAVAGDPAGAYCISETTDGSLGASLARIALPVVAALAMWWATLRRARGALAVISTIIGLAWVAALVCAGDPHDRGGHEETLILAAAPALALVAVCTIVVAVVAAVRGRRIGERRWLLVVGAGAAVLFAIAPAARAVHAAGTSPHWLRGTVCFAAAPLPEPADRATAT